MMASRVEIAYSVDKTVGGNAQPVSGASVQVNLRGGGAALVYGAETGGSPIPNPLTTDANGEINGWADEGSYTLVISGSGITTRSQPIELVRGDTTSTIGTAKLQDSSVTNAKLADGSVGTTKLADGSVTAVKMAAGVGVPTGAMLPFAGSSAPSGYLICDGSSVAIASYGALYAVIGTTYGGSGGNFNLPDTRGRSLAGKGTHTDVDALGKSDSVSVGSRTPKHTHSISSDGAHSHTVDPHGHYRGDHVHGVFVPTTSAAGGSVGGSISGVAASPPSHTHTAVGNTGGGGAGYSDNATPGTNSAGAHTHGGATGIGGTYLVVNHVIKT